MSQLVPLPLERLACDGLLPTAIYTAGKTGSVGGRGGTVLLLAKGSRLTPDLLERLKERGVCELIVDKDFLAEVSREEPGVQAPPVREPVPVSAGRRLPPDALIHSLTRPAGLPTPERRQAARARRDALAAGLDALFADAQPDVFGGPSPLRSMALGAALSQTTRALSRRIDGQGLRTLSAQSVENLCEDFDLFTAVGLSRPANAVVEPGDGDAYSSLLSRLREHAVRTTHLALAIGTIVGLRRYELEQLAMGCLVHDAGMAHVDPALWDGPHRLDSAQFVAVADHPRHTLGLLRGVPGIPAGARAVAVQIHERADGSGYPFRLKGGRIHRLSRLASIADAYCGMTADRPHRPALPSHSAVRSLAADAIRGHFDPASMRAFLETVGLFPPGAAVVLSDGRCGRVVEADREWPAGPRVELWDPIRDCFTGEVVDLALRAPFGPEEAGSHERPRIVSTDEFGDSQSWSL
ncbi:HD-GYP domain-containing protein [Alienimonas chondri]|uniref:HD-GYP domain-containing protein n=1 Tax=Alienimonas chondri TaxID=2681879 RepID=A0ABX1VEY4_9PLAN|nr:HD domain-containing phosphohydrolase [Alienimonas chondri]NNJ26650.1 hypothetical protein [Alienimonas chondri]